MWAPNREVNDHLAATAASNIRWFMRISPIAPRMPLPLHADHAPASLPLCRTSCELPPRLRRDRQCIGRFMRINTSRLGTSSHRRSFATANEAHRLITSKPTPCTGHADTHRTLASIVVRVLGPSCAIDRCEPIPCTDHAHTDHTELLQSSSRARSARAPSTVATLPFMRINRSSKRPTRS